MLRHTLLMAAAAIGVLLAPAVAEAASARITGNVNLRTGPGSQYYKIATLPSGAPVEVFGCLNGYTWCDVGYGGLRGWVTARYLSVFYNRNVFLPSRPIITLPFLAFDFGYWDRHYQGRPWYSHRPHGGPVGGSGIPWTPPAIGHHAPNGPRPPCVGGPGVCPPPH